MNPDPLYVEKPEPELVGRETERLAIGAVAVALGVGLVIIFGIVVVRAAPRSAQDVMPVVAERMPARTNGNLPAPTGAPQRTPSVPPDGRAGSGAPLSGIASWYPARGLIAAAGPRLRVGHWRGSSVVVRAGARSVVVRLADWCQCLGSRLLDLSDDAFRQLAPLSRGLVAVTVNVSGPAPTLPATDRSAP